MQPALPLCCSHCGSLWGHQGLDASWPRTCTSCGTTTWRNTLPVVVVVILADHPESGEPHVLVGRRAIPPALGKLGLIAGFMENQKGAIVTWQEEAAREVHEETSGLVMLDTAAIHPHPTTPFITSMGVPGVVLLVCHTTIPWPDLSAFQPNDEVSHLALVPVADVGVTVDLAFLSHEEAVQALPQRSPR